MSTMNTAFLPSSIPLGLMMDASEYRMANSRVKGMVLEQVVNFDPLPYVSARTSMFDVHVIDMAGEPVLMFVLQIEDARLTWLANPAEPDVWKSIGAWRANDSVSVALTNNNSTHLFVVPFRRRKDDSVLALRRNKQLVADLLTIDAIALLGARALDNYEIPGLPAPAHSVACLLHTVGADRVLQRLGYWAEWDAKAGVFHARRVADDTQVVSMASPSVH